VRIVSLLPSATEIVSALGLADDLVGITHECDYPPDVASKPVMITPVVHPGSLSSPEIDAKIAGAMRDGTGVYRLDVEAIRRADPDLIITQELCDVCAVGYDEVMAAIKDLARAPQVLSLGPRFMFDMIRDVQTVAQAARVPERATPIVAALRRRIDRVVEQRKNAEHVLRVACLEWLDPVYVAGHWIPEMVELAGGRDLFGAKGNPSKKIPWEAVAASRPDVLILMPCGFDVPRALKEVHFLTQRPGWSELPAVRNGRVWIVNGHAYYNRSGPRLVDGLEFMAHMLYPEWFPRQPPAEAAILLTSAFSSLGGGKGEANTGT